MLTEGGLRADGADPRRGNRNLVVNQLAEAEVDREPDVSTFQPCAVYSLIPVNTVGSCLCLWCVVCVCVFCGGYYLLPFMTGSFTSFSTTP